MLYRWQIEQQICRQYLFMLLFLSSFSVALNIWLCKFCIHSTHHELKYTKNSNSLFFSLSVRLSRCTKQCGETQCEIVCEQIQLWNIRIKCLNVYDCGLILQPHCDKALVHVCVCIYSFVIVVEENWHTRKHIHVYIWINVISSWHTCITKNTQQL